MSKEQQLSNAQAHVPTEPASPFQDARFSQAYEDLERARGSGSPPCQRTQARLRKAWIPRVSSRIVTFSLLQQGPKRGLRFPKSARLLKHRDFEDVYQNGRRYSLPHFAAFYVLREPNQQTGVRVGFTVGRVLGGAVERNRIRRRLREAVRLSFSAVPQQLTADVILQPRKSALLAGFEELRQQVAEALAAVQQNRGSNLKRRREAKVEK